MRQHTLAACLPLASSPLWGFSVHSAIWMCKNTTQNLYGSHSPASLDVFDSSFNFQMKSQVKPWEPTAGHPLCGQRREEEGTALSRCKTGGFVFGCLVISIVYFLYFNIWKITTTTFRLWLFSQWKLCWKSLFYRTNTKWERGLDQCFSNYPTWITNYLFGVLFSLKFPIRWRP